MDLLWQGMRQAVQLIAEADPELLRILTRHPGKPHAMWQLDQLRFAAEFDLADALHGERGTNG